MLFILTGQIQTGKTRWLTRLLDDVQALGVLPFGVLAPGVWREVGGSTDVSTPEQAPKDVAPPAQTHEQNFVQSQEYEKLAIENILLPQNEKILFAQRRDLANAQGALDSRAQSERARLGWYIHNSSIDVVNAHINAALSKGVLACAQDCIDQACAQGCNNAPRAQALLIIDEFGRLELLQNEGLTSAVQLLKQGAQPGCNHAIIIVRESLRDIAKEKFASAWGGCAYIYPNAQSKQRVLSTLKLSATPAHMPLNN